MIISKKVQNIKISSGNDGQRLDNFLLSKIKNMPKSHVYKLIRTGQVRINSSRSKPSSKLKIGDIIRIPPIISSETLKPKISKDIIAKTLKNILYEDENIIVFNKPSSFAVHSGTKIGYGLIDIMREVKTNCERIDLLHRLDKDTSGCIIITKSLSSLRMFQEKIKKNKLEKKYICLVDGLWDKSINKSEIELSRNNKKYNAISEFKIIKKYKNSTLLEVKIITGRYHQIRKHCALLNHAIIGDKKYCDKKINKIYKKLGLNRIFLHAFSISFKTNYSKNIKCPIPSELDLFLKKHK